MPSVVYRIMEVLPALLADVPIGANLAVFHLPWAMLSG